MAILTDDLLPSDFRLPIPTNAYEEHLNRILLEYFNRLYNGATDNPTVTGYITGKKCGAFASLDSSAITTITTAGTYYPIQGTFSNDPINDFDVATVYTPGIKYIGSKTQYFEIDWHAELSGNRNNITINIGTKKNGVVCTSGVMGCFMKNLDQNYHASGTCVYELAYGDEVQLVVTSDGDGDLITFNSFTTTITEFFD